MPDISSCFEMTSNVSNTQYNQIVDAYSRLYPPTGVAPDDYPLAIIEDAQLHLAVTEASVDIRGKRILDLACGTGYFASKWLRWGAESITGVDISASMLDAARMHAKERGIPETKLNFVLGDATDDSITIDGAPFDIVTGCWLLNYAPDAPTMTKMWNFIGRHLKPGGTFLGLTIPPLLTGKPEEGEMLAWTMSSSGPWGRNGNLGKVLDPLPNGDGFNVRIELGTDAQDEMAVFETYHPTLRVFEDSIRQSGMFTGLEWRDFVIPEEVKKNKAPGYWNDLALWPHCRVCVGRRSV